MNIDVLQGTFSATTKPGLDTLDPRWAEVSGLVQAGQFAEAARASDELLRQDIFDVRLVGYLCFGQFLEAGPGTLADIFAALGRLLDGNWDAIGPTAQKTKVTQQTLGWLFKQALKQAQRLQADGGAPWETWTGALTPARLDEALAAGGALQAAATARLAEAAPPLVDAIGKLQVWLRALHEQLAAAVVAPAAPPTDAPAPPADVPTAAVPATVATPAASGDPSAVGSYHLALLLKKIDALGRLLGAGKLSLARIVATDIGESMAQFDPLLYFPSLFAGFAGLMARHAGAMSEVDSDPESPVTRALRALYQVDLEAFVALE